MLHCKRCVVTSRHLHKHNDVLYHQKKRFFIVCVCCAVTKKAAAKQSFLMCKTTLVFLHRQHRSTHISFLLFYFFCVCVFLHSNHTFSLFTKETRGTRTHTHTQKKKLARRKHSERHQEKETQTQKSEGIAHAISTGKNVCIKLHARNNGERHHITNV